MTLMTFVTLVTLSWRGAHRCLIVLCVSPLSHIHTLTTHTTYLIQWLQQLQHTTIVTTGYNRYNAHTPDGDSPLRVGVVALGNGNKKARTVELTVRADDCKHKTTGKEFDHPCPFDFSCTWIVGDPDDGRPRLLLFARYFSSDGANTSQSCPFLMPLIFSPISKRFTCVVATPSISAASRVVTYLIKSLFISSSPLLVGWETGRICLRCDIVNPRRNAGA